MFVSKDFNYVWNCHGCHDPIYETERVVLLKGYVYHQEHKPDIKEAKLPKVMRRAMG